MSRKRCSPQTPLSLPPPHVHTDRDDLIGFEWAAICVKTTRQSCWGWFVLLKQLRHSSEDITALISCWRRFPFVWLACCAKKCRSAVFAHSISVCLSWACRAQPWDLVTLKMVALCGRGGAGRDGDVVVLEDGGWLGGDGPLIEALTDLEHKRRNYIQLIIHLMILISYKWRRFQIMKSKHITHSNWLHIETSSHSAASITNKHILTKRHLHLK